MTTSLAAKPPSTTGSDAWPARPIGFYALSAPAIDIDLAVPGCGTAWTTDPGNSTPPPAGPLPSYMAVIVSSNVTKSGPSISGNTVHVVIVMTDPGYAANPGHAGTGNVVATVC